MFIENPYFSYKEYSFDQKSRQTFGSLRMFP